MGNVILKKLVFVFLILCGFAYFNEYDKARGADRDAELYKQIELFSDAVTIVRSDYVENPEPKKLVYGALSGMLSSLDGYSQFMDPDEFKEMQIETKGEFGGLGIEIAIRDNALTVIAPMDGTPAHKAGIKAGDKIVKIDGELTQDITLTGAVKKLRGKPKTKVVLSIFRKGEKDLLDFTIVRSIIKLESIKTAKMLDGELGYVKLIEFQEKTPSDLEKALLELKQKGMKGLILDVRNNPGGLLDTAYEVSNKFLPEGKVIVSLEGRVPKQNKIYKSHGKTNFTDFPLVVLVNEGSASASEIVAGAMQDNKRGTIVGTTTFGKGSVQTVVPLDDGSAVRLTTAAYHTPSGRVISNKGIIPDVEIKPEEKPDGTEPETPVKDNQLQAAIDVLKQKVADKIKGKHT
ncbi:MAG: S41 family peptidase [Candidatus Omnitrophica bacterium]|nr:S41 family peptidase [Candidatus Omnitrophota bacterium]